MALALPPAVLAWQLGQSQWQDDTLSQQVLRNPGLLCEILARRGWLQSPVQDSLLHLDAGWLRQVVLEQSLRLCLEPGVALDPVVARLWERVRLQGLLALGLARELAVPDPLRVAVIATLGACGPLLMAQAHGQAWLDLSRTHPDLSGMLSAERSEMGITHVDLLVGLMQQWQLPGVCCDVARYQYAAATDVRDASQLVRLAWSSRLLAWSGSDASSQDGLPELVGMTSHRLLSVFEEANRLLADELQRLDLPGVSSGMAAPLTANAHQDHLQVLRQQLLSESAFDALRKVPMDNIEGLVAGISQALRTGGFAPRFALLEQDREQPLLRLAAQCGLTLDDDEYALHADPARSMVSAAVGGDTLAALDLDSADLKVVDRQLLSAFGGAMLCDPVANGSRRAALLLPLHQGYAMQAPLRNALRDLLLTWLRREPDALAAGETLVRYRRHVRETIHEINNPLAVIRNYLQLFALRTHAQDVDTSRQLYQLTREIDRMGGLLSSLRELPRAAAMNVDTLDLNRVVQDTGSLLRAAYAKEGSMIINLRTTQDTLMVQANADGLRQVLTNLVKNAVEAMPQGGEITIDTAAPVVWQDSLYAQLRISDNGPGIVPERMMALFHREGSDKGGMHSGSGLAIVKRLVDDMHGIVSCRSDHAGTVFSVLLELTQ